jgi:hypothetical protein
MGYNKKTVKIYSVLITLIILSSFMQIVWAATEDTVIITFDPDGSIDIDINLATYNFSSAVAGTWTNSTGGAFTIYNNGTVPMDTQIRSNASTDEGDMDLNESGIAPRSDEYAIYIIGLDTENYVNSSYTIEFDQSLFPLDSKTFDIGLLMGNLSANHTWQTTTIFFQGSIS